MQTMILGRTGLSIAKTAFGCLPIQRIPKEDAAALLRRALKAGITFFDTARVYTDSEEKIGEAFAGIPRESYVLATKTHAKTGEELWGHLRESLSLLRIQTIDIYQFHNPSFVPMPGGADGLYDAAIEAKRQGLIRHIGITQHSLELAKEAVLSGLYDTLQYPFNHLATDEEVALARLCEAEGVGFICMKALSGGLITDASIPFAYLSQFPGVVPIWGFQRPEELEQLIALSGQPPMLDEAMQARIEVDRTELAGSFCRGCGYCLPCPADIPIQNANRITQLMQRSPVAPWLAPDWADAMEHVEACTRCGLCAKRCPYGLKPYETLPGHLAFYRKTREAFLSTSS